MDDQGAEGARYRAFISYSHVDQAFGRRLHRRLERYLLPRRLVGRQTARGRVPRRIAPVFRDREEFSAAGDLTAEVRAALSASAALIVVCSPAAAASPWVTREVELFRELHPDRPVLAAIAEGEPKDCFPRPLTLAGGAPIEPLAADFRPHADGPRLGLLKLVAGVAGVGLDELVQRDAHRRLVGVTAITSAAVAVALVMTALTTFAVLAQREAERQRGQAEALVEFMLTDLRDRLKGVGRLDVLTSVNERTLAYYADQDVDRLPPESQARYARILLAMGEDDMTRGRAGPALEKFRMAERVTGSLLAQAPNDPEDIWAQGQSEYWLGYHAYLADDRREAGQRWGRYRDLAQRLVTASPGNGVYRKELAYAEGNLCTLALKKPAQVGDALRHCAASLQEMQRSAQQSPGERSLVTDLTNRHAWMADAYWAAGRSDLALEHRREEQKLLDQAISKDPNNMDLRQRWVVLQRAYAVLEYQGGDRPAALARLTRARAVVAQMSERDPENQSWSSLRQKLERSVAYLTQPKSQESSGARQQ